MVIQVSRLSWKKRLLNWCLSVQKEVPLVLEVSRFPYNTVYDKPSVVYVPKTSLIHLDIAGMLHGKNCLITNDFCVVL